MRLRIALLGEWLRAARPFICRCGHARSHHASGRGHCARCATCAAPVRMTRWSLLTIGYRIGLEAGRMTARVSTVTVATEPDPPTVVLDVTTPEDWSAYSWEWSARDGVSSIPSPPDPEEEP